MSHPWTARKQTELKNKLGGLTAEFSYWKEQSDPAEERADPRFKIHNSQIRLVVNRLEVLEKRVSERLNAVVEKDSMLLDQGIEIEVLTLGIHRLWGFFRTKFAQRLEERSRYFLAVADQLAWVCYKPFREARYGANSKALGCKEPPLVYLNGGWSPFAMPRRAAFDAEMVPGEPLSGSLADFLNLLPVPVIGLPWYQVEHLPDILVVAHEVGHLVVDDFGLRAAIVRCICAAIETDRDSRVRNDRSAAWESWADEIFADLFGCAACGPAFVSSLSDYLVCDGDRSLSALEIVGNWGDYPATDLRMRINFAALRELGFAEDAQALEDAWRHLAGSVDHGGFADDVPRIVGALLKSTLTPLPDSIVTILPSLSPAQWKKRSVIYQMTESETVQTADARLLLTAVRGNYDDDPARYLDPEVNKALVEKIHRRMQEEMNVRSSDTQGGLSQKLIEPLAPAGSQQRNAPTGSEADVLFAAFSQTAIGAVTTAPEARSRESAEGAGDTEAGARSS